MGILLPLREFSLLVLHLGTLVRSGESVGEKNQDLS